MKKNFNEHRVSYTNQNESGRTMLEMLGVLAIMGIITYGAIAGINYGMSSYKINQTYAEVQDIIQGIEDLYSWSKGYPTRDDLMTAACANAIFTNSDSCSTGENRTVRGAFGDMWVEGAECQGGGRNSCANFTIHIPITDSNDCTRLAQMDWKANSIECVKCDGERCECNDRVQTDLCFSPM
ncbi:MAG: type II secretion system protein [Alphaproteobacteria bacterium]